VYKNFHINVTISDQYHIFASVELFFYKKLLTKGLCF